MKSVILSMPLLLSCMLFAGCTSLVQKGGELLEGSAFEERALSLYRSITREPVIELRELSRGDGAASGDKTLELTSSAWPGLTLRGSMPGSDGRFELTELRFLSSHARGWNEFTLDLLGGSAAFPMLGQPIGILRMAGEPERVQISSGKIRLKSSRLNGAGALVPLRNRRERILALVEWMGEGQVFSSQKEFEDYWKPLLFPELVLESKRPEAYSMENARWLWEDSVRWNLAYTEYLFPEDLWEYRNSGALLRDWEEALPWIYMEYSWGLIISSFNQVTLQKIN